MNTRLLLLLTLLAATASNRGAADGATMQAAVAGAGTVRVQTLARPAVAAGQVLVKLRFAGVNPADWKDAPARAAAIPGLDGSGVVMGLGAGVTGYRIGDPVIVWSRARGTYAQYVAVPAQTLVHKPGALSFEQAAGMAHAGLAAWNMLIDVAQVRAGQSVLVLGGCRRRRFRGGADCQDQRRARDRHGRDGQRRLSQVDRRRSGDRLHPGAFRGPGAKRGYRDQHG
jgi:hypothetical protein